MPPLSCVAGCCGSKGAGVGAVVCGGAAGGADVAGATLAELVDDTVLETTVGSWSVPMGAGALPEASATVMPPPIRTAATDPAVTRTLTCFLSTLDSLE
jgi:hypothetical protein